MFGMSFAKIADSVRRNHLGLASTSIVTEKLTISSAAINDVGIRRIRSDVAALTGARGALDCTSNTTVSAIGLRFVGSDEFSSLPIIFK
jgi:hypothetical protein